MNLELQASWPADTSIWTKKGRKEFEILIRSKIAYKCKSSIMLRLSHFFLLRKIFYCEQEHPLIDHSIHWSCFTTLNKKHGFLGQERNITNNNFSEEEVHQPGSSPHLNYENLSLVQKNDNFDDTHPRLHILKDGREGSCLLPSSCVA